MTTVVPIRQNEFMEKWKQNLDRAIAASDTNKSALSKAIGRSNSYVTDLLTSPNSSQIEAFFSIADTLQIDPVDLYYGDDPYPIKKASTTKHELTPSHVRQLIDEVSSVFEKSGLSISPKEMGELIEALLELSTEDSAFLPNGMDERSIRTAIHMLRKKQSG